MIGLLKEADKQKHMLGSALIAYFLFSLGVNIFLAFTLSVLLGLCKELLDTNSFKEHLRDMIANTIGAASVFISYLLLLLGEL